MKGSIMKASFKLIGVSALALTLGFCGCGDKESGSGGGSAPSACAMFKPLVGKDVQLAIGVNLDKEQAFKIVDAYAGLVFDLSKLDEDDVQKAKEKIAAYKKDLFTDADQEARAFIEKSGLRDADIGWAVVSMENFNIEGGEPQLNGLSVAIGGKVDLEKLILASQNEAGAKMSFEAAKLEGEKVWHIVPHDEKTAKGLKKSHADPYVASLDGRLVLVAMSRDTLAKQIRLYRNGEGKGDALGGFSAAEGEFMRYHLSGIGDLVRNNTSRNDLRMIKQVIPDGDEIVYGLKKLTVDSVVRSDGTVSDTLRLETASEKDADQLRTLAKTGVMTATAHMAKEREAPKGLKKIIEDVKVGGTDGQVEVKCGSFGVGVLAGALFPAISSAMLSANASVLALNGRKLYVGMMQANVERMSAGVGSVWPRTKATAGADKKDIADRASASAFEYFTALFDMEHYGTSEWDPCVDGDLLSSLGKKAVVGKTINASGLDWCIAANVTDKMPDDAIVLVSGNFNPALLLRKWDGQADGKKILPIGPKSGAPKSMLGDRAVVIVRKGGSAETIKKKFLTYDVLYRKQAFDITNMDPPLVYLTPTGVVEPVGHE